MDAPDYASVGAGAAMYRLEGPCMDDSKLVEKFVDDGFVRVDDAFPRDVAEACREILWRESGCDPNDRTTWTRPVIRVGVRADPPFLSVGKSRRLVEALDEILGREAWVPLGGLGTFPIRFPSTENPGDTGWHIDVSYSLPEDDAGNFMHWRANVFSRGRGLLLLLLFSDVGPDDAPTRVRVGSHQMVARLLGRAGESGMRLEDLVASDFSGSGTCQIDEVVGAAGTAYLCHPFLVHSAQLHHGIQPRFMAQPPVLMHRSLELMSSPAASTNAVERAIRTALAG